MVIIPKRSVETILPCGRPVRKSKETSADSKALLETVTAKLKNFALEKGLNRSEAREKIVETIVYEARHFTTLDLLERLQKRFPEVGKATVYRNLPVLVESGIIKEGPMDPSGQALYELADEDHHDHIVCLDCRQIIEFHDEVIEKRQESISSSLKFLVKDHRHIIFASCGFKQDK